MFELGVVLGLMALIGIIAWGLETFPVLALVIGVGMCAWVFVRLCLDVRTYLLRIIPEKVRIRTR